MAGRLFYSVRSGTGHHVRAATAASREPADRPSALPIAGLQRRPGPVSARNVRRVRSLRLHRAVPAAGTRALAAAGGARDDALHARVRGRLLPRATDRAPV